MSVLFILAILLLTYFCFHLHLSNWYLEHFLSLLCYCVCLSLWGILIFFQFIWNGLAFLSGERNGNPVFSSILAWRIPGMAEPGGLPSMRPHRVGHDWSGSSSSSLLITEFYLCIFLFWTNCRFMGNFKNNLERIQRNPVYFSCFPQMVPPQMNYISYL